MRASIFLRVVIASASLYLPLGKTAWADCARAAWLWSGRDARLFADAMRRYVYQGNLRGERFERRGISPHELSGDVVPVLRLIPDSGKMPSSTLIATGLRELGGAWERRGAHIVGVQIDYDSPTSKLGAYAALLAEVKTELGGRYPLSITGLADWLGSGKPNDLAALFATADEVAIQLYNGRAPVLGWRDVARRALRLGHSVTLGITPSMRLPEDVCVSTALRRVIVFNLE